MILGIVSKFFNSICVLIDKIIYSFIEKVYELFILISEAGVFSQNTIQEFAGRIYIFLGLIMLFVVSISLVQYILDPKKFGDSKIGGAKLVKDFAFVLIAIIAIPYVFEAAFRLQRIVLKDNIIGSLILGLKYTGEETDESNNPSHYATYGGKIMAYSAASAFVTLSPEIASYACINQPVNAAGELSDACSNLKGLKYDGGGYDKDGVVITDFDKYIETYSYAKDFRYLLNENFVSFEVEKDGVIYSAVDYTFLISSIAGGFIIYILLGFCIDIAVRSVKLSFLQLIAPIPLMMKIIPGGEKRFKTWSKQCVSTYCELFVKLAAIYFAIFIIASISTDGIQNVGGSGFVQTTLVRVAIIFGALMFASELPKLLKDILGGSGGNFKLGGPMKKIMSSPISGAVAGAAVGGTLAAGVNVVKGVKNAKSHWSDPENKGLKGALKRTGLVFSPLTSGIGGGFSGALKGGKNGSTGKNTLYKAGTDAAAASSQARNKRDAGFGMTSNMRKEWSRISGQTNNSGTFSELDNEIAKKQNIYADKKNLEDRTAAKYSDKFSEYMVDNRDMFDSEEKINEFESLWTRPQDDKTGAYLDFTEEQKKAQQEFIDNNLNYQVYQDAFTSSEKEYIQAEQAYDLYLKNVESGAIKKSEAQEKQLKRAKDECHKRLNDSKEIYEARKARRKGFDELASLETLKNHLNTQTIAAKSALEKAEANKKKYN